MLVNFPHFYAKLIFMQSSFPPHLFPESSVAKIHAHLRRHPEKPGDEVVRLENPVLVHELDKDDEGLPAVARFTNFTKFLIRNTAK
jgi:hypothetical protein